MATITASTTTESANHFLDAKSSDSCHRKPLDQKGGRGQRTAEFQIRSDHGNVVHHLRQAAGDRDFFHWIAQLSIFDPQTDGSARIISGNDVYSKTDQFGDVKPRFDGAQHLLNPIRARLKIEIFGTYGWRSRYPTRRISGGSKIELARSIGIEQIILQDALADNWRNAGRNPFVIKGPRAESPRAHAVIQNVDIFIRYALAQLAGKERCAAVDGIPADRLKKVTDDGTCGFGIKKDRNSAGFDLARAQPANRTLCRFPPNRFGRFQNRRASTHGIPIVTLQAAARAIHGYWNHREPTVGSRITSHKPERVGVGFSSYAGFERGSFRISNTRISRECGFLSASRPFHALFCRKLCDIRRIELKIAFVTSQLFRLGQACCRVFGGDPRHAERSFNKPVEG